MVRMVVCVLLAFLFASPFCCWSAYVVSVCFLGVRGGCFCMLACFLSLVCVCVHRRRVQRCSPPRPPLLLVFFLPAACFLRTHDGSGIVGADGVG